MKKYALAAAVIAALTLTACTQGADTSSAPEATHPSATPATSAQSTLSTAEEFEGTTLKGNHLHFAFLSPGQQEYMNNLTNTKYSWGALCSPTATAEQLNETGISVQDPDGETSVLRSIQKASAETVALDENVESGFAQLIEAASYPDTAGETCVGVVSDDGEVATRSYETVLEGQYLGTTELADTVELTRK